jgi:hypothetical protein
MNQISTSVTSNLPVLLNLKEINEMIIDFMRSEGEELIYAFTDRKGNKCNQFFFTTHKLIIADRMPNVPFKVGKFFLTGWGGDLEIPYDLINEIETRQYKTLFMRKKRDLSIVFKDFETFLSSKDTYNFLTLLASIHKSILIS